MSSSPGIPGAEAEPAPVFVDRTGRRGRRLRGLGWVAGVVCVGLAVAMISGLVGTQSQAPAFAVPDDADTTPPSKYLDAPLPSPPGKGASRAAASASASPSSASPSASGDTATAPAAVGQAAAPSAAAEPPAATERPATGPGPTTPPPTRTTATAASSTATTGPATSAPVTPVP